MKLGRPGRRKRRGRPKLIWPDVQRDASKRGVLSRKILLQDVEKGRRCFCVEGPLRAVAPCSN